MSSQWSMYVVPDEWTLDECIAISYMVRTELMMKNEEFVAFQDFKNDNWDRLYDELIMKQPCLYNYTSDDGDPDHEEIMSLLSPTGRLYRFPEKLYELIPDLMKFAKEHEGKRYICLN